MTHHFYAERLTQVLPGKLTECHPGGRLARARALQDRARVVVPVLLHAGQVGVARPRAGQRGVPGHVGQVFRRDGVGRHYRLPLGPFSIGDPDRDRAAKRAAMPDPAGDLDLVLLEFHPGAAAIPGPPARQRGGDIGSGDPHPGRKALVDRDERPAV